MGSRAGKNLEWLWQAREEGNTLVGTTESQNMLTRKGPIKVTESTSCLCTGHPKDPTM